MGGRENLNEAELAYLPSVSNDDLTVCVDPVDFPRNIENAAVAVISEILV